LAAKLTAAGVYNRLAAIPYGEHGYDILWGSLGGQISRQVVADFLRRCYPRRNDRAGRSSLSPSLSR
jgi:hypothetical protein